VARSAPVFTVSRDFPRAAEGIPLATAFPGCALARMRAQRSAAYTIGVLRKSNVSDFLLRKYRMPQIYAGIDTCAKRVPESPIFKDPFKHSRARSLRNDSERNEPKETFSSLSIFQISFDAINARAKASQIPTPIWVPLNIAPANRRECI
jgi:hypothetical protein